MRASRPRRPRTSSGRRPRQRESTNQQEARLALQSARAATKYAPYLDDAALEDLAGVTAATAKRFDIRPEQAIGFAERGRAQSNVRELSSYTANVSPVINNLTEFGATPSEASALMAMMTQQLGDTTGEMSGTASINLMKSLQDRFGKRADFQRADGSFNPIKAMSLLQQNDEARRRFFEGGDFYGEQFGKATLGKGKAIPTIKGLLSGRDTKQAQQMSGSYYAIGDFADGQQTFEDSVRTVRDRRQSSRRGESLMQKSVSTRPMTRVESRRLFAKSCRSMSRDSATSSIHSDISRLSVSLTAILALIRSLQLRVRRNS